MEHNDSQKTYPVFEGRIITLQTIDWLNMAGGSLLSVATWY